MTETEKPVRLFFYRPPLEVEEGYWLLARSHFDAEEGCELPDGLERLYAIASNALYLVGNVADPFLEACHNDFEDSDPLLTDLMRFKNDLRWLSVLCDEGWRLLRKYERLLASSAGGAVQVYGIVGTSAHETALRLADHVICKITGWGESELFSRRAQRASPSDLKQYLQGLKKIGFRKEVEEIPKRTGFVEAAQLHLLEEQLRSEYLKTTVDRMPDKPIWDADRRELRFQRLICKRFRQKASNQIRVLAAFQEADWPARIDDPIPPVRGTDHRQRLADTVRGLNNGTRGIHFELDGTGEGILWKPIDGKAP